MFNSGGRIVLPLRPESEVTSEQESKAKDGLGCTGTPILGVGVGDGLTSPLLNTPTARRQNITVIK